MQKVPKSYWERAFIAIPVIKLRCQGISGWFGWGKVWKQRWRRKPWMGTLSPLLLLLLPGCFWIFMVFLFPVRNAGTVLGWVLLQIYPSGKAPSPQTCSPQGFWVGYFWFFDVQLKIVQLKVKNCTLKVCPGAFGAEYFWFFNVQLPLSQMNSLMDELVWKSRQRNLKVLILSLKVWYLFFLF